LTDEKKIERWTLTIPADAAMPRTIAVRPFAVELADVTAFDTVVAEPAVIVLAAGNGSLRWIDTNTGQPIRQAEHGAPVHSISISPDNAKVASAGADGNSKIWNFADAQLAATLGGDWMAESLVLRSQREATRRQALVDRMAARIPELEKAVQAEVDAKKKVEEVRVKAVEAVAAKQQELEKAMATVVEHEKMIADAKAAVEAAMKRVEQLNTELDPKKKAQEAAQVAKAAADMEVVKHDQAIAAADEAINRATAAVPAQQQKVEAEKQVVQAALASVETIKQEAAAKRKPVLSCAFDREGRTLLTAQDDNTLRAYSVDGSRQTALWNGLTFTPRNLVALPSGLLVASKPDVQPSLWNSKMEWRLERVIGTPEESPFSDRVTALDFNADGSLLAVGGGAPSRSGELKIVNVADGAIARDLGPVHSDTVLGTKFSPDGKQIATCGADKLAKIWDVATGQALKTLEGHTHHVLSIAWQDDGFTVATGSADNTVKIWDPATGEQRRTIGGFPKEVTSITYVGQSANLLSTCADSQVRLHDTNNGNAIRTFGGATDFLYSLTVSSDNRFAVAGGQDGVLRAWNVETGALIQQLK
jgi:WD40 repeat protein